ncbi:MAG TPA: Gfo/Idh/MocA family oxidoreductase [Terriglobales bacterium]|nr:Gfo/Idh/MocA family oxidoreductase [Terriglobales bacterium]
MIRYGILGFGLHAVKRLMPGFSQAKHCTVTGLWRRDQRKAQEARNEYSQFPLQVYDSPEALCASSDVDAIFVASPDALHLQHVLVALEHRKPVLCEKPMAMNAGECERMLAAAEGARVPLGVAQNFRFEPSVNRIREIVAAGTIGKPLLARSEFHYYTRQHARTWISDPSLACGGPVGDVGVHCIDALRYILQDEVSAVFARALYDNESGAVESAATLVLEFQKGPIAAVTVSTRGEYRSPLWIMGDGGLVGAEDALAVDHAIALHTRPIGGEISTEHISNDTTYADQVDAFALHVEQGIPFVAPGTEGLRNQQVLDAAYRSVKSGSREEI